MKTPIAALALVSLASLASAGGGGGLTARYICAGNTRVQATYTGSYARVVVDGRVLGMTQGLSGSGARYVGGGYTWWINGRGGELYQGENPGSLTSLRQCQEG